MDQQAIITLAIAVIALTLKPGPNMMMVMSRTIAHGMKACTAFMLGVFIVTLLYLALVFISFNIPGLDMVFISILTKSLAAAFLIWMGVKGLQDIQLKYENNKFDDGFDFFETFNSGLILTLSNPLTIVFYAGILPTILNMNEITFQDMMIVTVIVSSVEGLLPFLYCAPFALFRKKIPIKFLKGLRIFSSVVIILVGLYIGYTALPAEDLKLVF